MNTATMIAYMFDSRKESAVRDKNEWHGINSWSSDLPQKIRIVDFLINKSDKSILDSFICNNIFWILIEEYAQKCSKQNPPIHRMWLNLDFKMKKIREKEKREKQFLKN